MNKEFEIRRIALETLLEKDRQSVPSHVLIKAVLDKYDYLSNFEKSIIGTLIKGVIERKIELDYIINLYSKTKTSKMKPVIRTILEMGVYQILYMEVYDTAAVDLCVMLAKKKGFTGLSGFVNGVLRTIVRNKDTIAIEETKDAKYLHVKYSIPEDVVELLINQYPFETVETILKASLDSKGLHLRFKENLSKERIEEIKDELLKRGCQISDIEGFDNMIKISKTGRLSEIPAFNKGEITIQDASSVLMCKNVPFGEKILDACAAPGGKSAFIAERFPDSKITACDISVDKLLTMADNFNRLKLKNIKTEKQDATEFREEWAEAFDVVVADVPCSGLGVIGKKQDIKYRLSKEGIESLLLLQEQILNNVSKYVKKGGYLCYSTCTINKEENIERINSFLSKEDYVFDELTFVPDNLKEYANKGNIQLLQGINDTDGFFIAVLKKNG